jgi:pimeloyl-ACP methyl ester carboxylesterase
MARKFLFGVAGLIGMVLIAGIVWTLFGTQLMQKAFVPREEFDAPRPVTPNAYSDKSMWIARPDIPNNPALWRPSTPFPETTERATYPVFFIHPTSYLSSAHWNAPLDDKDANDRAALFVRGQASAFNHSPNIWAPKYRQAAFGAFLTDDPRAKQALDAAYADVAEAFDAFLSANKKEPFILAGHSQGSLHLLRLIAEKVRSTALTKRIIAAYVIGWPIGLTSDLPALGLPACATAAQSGCILSWQSFAEPADTAQVVSAFEAQPSLTGKLRKGDALLCSNPLTGTPNIAAGAQANLGTLKNDADFSGGTLIAGAVAARCDPRGFLLIGSPPKMGPYVLPGNNYHVYDYSLFWRNIRADAERRVYAYGTR